MKPYPIIFAAIATLLASAVHGENTFTITGSLATARELHTSTLLPDGKVLVTGGADGNNVLSSSERYNPTTGTWSVTGSLATARSAHTATLLPNGRVLIAGGGNSITRLGIGSIRHASAELYNPTAGSFTATGSLTTARKFHTATLLPNGSVLVTGGIAGNYLNSAELYNPTTGTWTATGSFATARAYHTATLLPNGLVLVAGGYSGVPLASAALFNPTTGSWTPTGSLTNARSGHTATLLSNGLVLVTGGFGAGIRFSSAELYNPATGIWTTTGSLATKRGDHTATQLSNGLVLVTGGLDGASLTSAELYNPTTGSWNTTGDLTAARANHTDTLLPNGRLLITGGIDPSFSPILSAELGDASFIQILDPALAGITAVKPTLADDGSGQLFELEFTMTEPMPAGMRLEVQASTDLGKSDPWATIASKASGAAWSGPAEVAVSLPSAGKVTITVSALQPTSIVGRQFFNLRLSSP